MTPAMFKSEFDYHRRAKALRDNVDLSIRRVSRETGLSVNTLQRVRTGDAGRVNLSTIEILLRYFGLTEISDLIKYTPDEDAPGG